MISVQALTKSYAVRRTLGAMLRHPLRRDRVAILRGVSLDVRERELFGLLGLNGAGKTTLLKIVATFVSPDAGRVLVDGLDVVADASEVRQFVAMVTADDRSLHWRLSAVENLRLFAGLHRLPAAQGRARSAEVLAMVGLDNAGEKIVGTFSSGMRQRLLVARALLSEPEVLLLDEPTRSLDPISAHDFRVMLRDRIIGELGTTVLLATHNAEEAFSYCDRVGVLHRGTIAATGPARALSSRFASDQYQIWSAAPRHRSFAELARERMLKIDDSGIDDGASVRCEIAGGPDAAAVVLRRLVESGNPVSRFERVPLALSALIGRIVAEHEQTGGIDIDA